MKGALGIVHSIYCDGYDAIISISGSSNTAYKITPVVMPRWIIPIKET